jgi:hypothetical protein
MRTFLSLFALAVLSGPASAAPAHVAKRHVAAPAAAPAAAPSAPRRLDEIHIEGEIPVPQVLFITAREQRRFLEFQHHRYLRTSRQLGEASVPPTHVVVTSSTLTPNPERPR